MTILDKVTLQEFLDIFLVIVNSYEETSDVGPEEKHSYQEWLNEIIGNITPEKGKKTESKISIYQNSKNNKIQVEISDKVSVKDIKDFISYVTSQKKVLRCFTEKAIELTTEDKKRNIILDSIKEIIYNDSIVLPSEVFVNASKN